MAETLHASPLIGRQVCLDRVHAWATDLSLGHGRAALIEGEPGIGKSALVREAASDAAESGCTILWSTCDELSQAFPLLPLVDALADGARGDGARGGDARERGASRIAELLRADTTTGNRVDPVAAATERLLAVMDELCVAAPVLLVVDDLQWADPATVVALGRLARNIPQLPLLMIGISRPGPRRDDLSALRRAVHPDDQLRLRGLAEDDVAEFVERRVGGPPGPRLLRLAEGAAGNPLYLTELIDALIRSRGLTMHDGTVEATGGRVPDSLPAAIADRLEFLTEPARGVLRAAALLGVDFSVRALAAVSGQRVNDLLPALDEAIGMGVLREDGASLAFRHPLIRAALYDELPAAVRAAWHRDAAHALADDGAAAEQVARQLLPALDGHDGGAVDEWLVRWLADTAHQLVGQAPHAAVPLLRWVVGGVPTGVAPHDLLACRLADALYRTGDVTEAVRVASSALAYVTRPDLLVDLHGSLAQCRAVEGRFEESLDTIENALKLPEIGPRQRARLLVLAARTHRTLGRVDTAGQVADEALAEATAAGDRWATGWALGVQTLVHSMRGEELRALPLFDRALAVAEGDPSMADLQLFLQINQAVALGDLDRYDDAIGAAERARLRADEAGNVVRLAQAQSVLGELFFDIGRWDDALAEVDLDSGAAAGPCVALADHGVVGTIRLHRGDPGAGETLADAKAYADRLGDRVVGSFTLAQSLDREQADAPEEALKILLAGLSDTAEEMEQSTDLFADAVRLAVSLGEPDTARAVVKQAEDVARASDVPHRQAVALHCRGLLDRDPVRLTRAADRYQAAGRPLARAQALEAAGVVLAGRGDLAAARVHFTGAFGLYSTLGAEWDLSRCQATFRGYGIRRGPRAQHRRSRQGWDSLTPTELKVVELVAGGMSNPQIAAHLFLSRRTVQTHVSHILAKLGMHSRTDIAREASRRAVEQ